MNGFRCARAILFCFGPGASSVAPIAGGNYGAAGEIPGAVRARSCHDGSEGWCGCPAMSEVGEGGQLGESQSNMRLGGWERAARSARVLASA